MRRSAAVLGLLLLAFVAVDAPGGQADSRTGEPGIEPAAPPAAPPTGLRVAVVSDLNGSYGETSYEDDVHTAVRRIRELRPDLVISTGDMVAGQRRGLDYRAMWRAFHATVSDPLAADGIPFAVTPGNHDASGYRQFSRERQIFVDEWSARRPDVDFIDGSGWPLRYSFRMGPALFVSLDATTRVSVGPEQKRWLARQLEQGRDRPVKIVYGHLPIYPFAEGRRAEAFFDPELEAMLDAHGVTAYLSGHHHAYYPGRRGPLRMVSLACLGTGPRALLGTRHPSPKSYALLRMDATGLRSVEAFTGPGLDERVDRATLPEEVGSGEWVIHRDDLPDEVERPILVSGD